MAAAVTLTMTAAIIYGSGHYPNDGARPLSMAAAVTLTMEAAIIYGSGQYPNDGFSLMGSTARMPSSRDLRRSENEKLAKCQMQNGKLIKKESSKKSIAFKKIK